MEGRYRYRRFSSHRFKCNIKCGNLFLSKLVIYFLHFKHDVYLFIFYLYKIYLWATFNCICNFFLKTVINCKSMWSLEWAFFCSGALPYLPLLGLRAEYRREGLAPTNGKTALTLPSSSCWTLWHFTLRVTTLVTAHRVMCRGCGALVPGTSKNRSYWPFEIPVKFLIKQHI